LAIDDVLVVDRGAAGLELHLHGSTAVLAALQRAFGLAPAAPHTAAERLLRAALSDEQLELALEQAAFDFAAEVGAFAALAPAQRARQRAAAIARSRTAMAMVQPQRVVFVGCQNAGKSTLFNRLLARERALTGPLAGLTRDPVRETTTLAGYPYELVDTAGEGTTLAAVDAAAVRAGRVLRATALTVLVLRANKQPTQLDDELRFASDLVVATQRDLGCVSWQAPWHPDAVVSAVADPVPDLRSTLGELFRRQRCLPSAGPVGGFAALDRAQLVALLGAG
jgi:small GTP-binding protein